MAINRKVGLKKKHRNEFTFVCNEQHYILTFILFNRIKLCLASEDEENSSGVLTVKLDYVLKGALVDIIPVLIMKNIIDTSSY
jgi:hypothetical protein